MMKMIQEHMDGMKVKNQLIHFMWIYLIGKMIQEHMLGGMNLKNHLRRKQNALKEKGLGENEVLIDWKR